MGIVYQRAVCTDGFLILSRCVKGHFNGPADAHTETCCFSNDDIHLFLQVHLVLHQGQRIYTRF